MADSTFESDADILRSSLSELLLRGFRANIYRQIEPGVDIPVRDGTYPILTALDAAPCRTTDLAERSGVDRTTASRQVSQLLAAGLVEQNTDPQDRRNTVVSLTPKGKSAAQRLASNADSLVRQALSDWQPDDRGAIARLLPRLLSDLKGAGAPPLRERG